MADLPRNASRRNGKPTPLECLTCVFAIAFVIIFMWELATVL